MQRCWQQWQMMTLGFSPISSTTMTFFVSLRVYKQHFHGMAVVESCNKVWGGGMENIPFCHLNIVCMRSFKTDGAAELSYVLPQNVQKFNEILLISRKKKFFFLFTQEVKWNLILLLSTLGVYVKFAFCLNEYI